MSVEKFEKKLHSNIYQIVVINLLKSNKSFTPAFVESIRDLYLKGESIQAKLMSQLDQEDKSCQIDCKKGCSHCCGLIVETAAPELYIILEHLLATHTKKQIDKITVKLKENIRLKKSKTERSERMAVKCAFLENQVCSIYQVRPLACRAWSSKNVNDCIQFLTNEEIEIPSSQCHYVPFTSIRKAITNALLGVGLKDVSEELNAGMLRLLEGEFGKT